MILFHARGWYTEDKRMLDEINLTSINYYRWRKRDSCHRQFESIDELGLEENRDNRNNSSTASVNT